jgi:hypothetical protein
MRAWGFGRRASGFGWLVALFVLRASVARADAITVGMFAPSAPFAGTAARVEYTQRLARAIAAELGKDGVGRAYGRAGDFASAVKKGEVQVAIVDARYAATAGGGGVVIGVGLRGGDDAAAWQLVTRGAKGVLELRGKKLLVPSMGGREADFVRNALYGGELAKDFFAKIDVAPDTAAALASLALGKADAAIVPAGADLPSGTQVVATLPPVSLPVVITYGLDDAARAKVTAALTAFQGAPALAGFKSANADVVHALARRMTVAEKRGPMAVPDVHIGVGDLVAGRAFAIPHADVKTFVAAPAASR